VKANTKDQPIKVPQFNLNSILTLIVSALLTFVWNSVIKLNENVARMQTTQEVTAQTLKDLMPKPEILLRFSVVEKDLIDLRSRATALEIEVAKIKR